MSNMRKCWSLYNREDKLRIDDLTIEQVRTILLAISSVRIHDWFACRDGDVQWHPISSIPEFYEDIHANVSKDPIPPSPQAAVSRRPLFEEAPSDQKTEATLAVESTQTKERRSARRYARKFHFRIRNAKQVFECATIDVSMSGLSLDQSLPSGLGKTFRAELSFQGNEMKIVCSRVSDTQVKLLEAEAWDLLRQWIANW